MPEAKIGYGTRVLLDSNFEIGQVIDAAISGTTLETVDATHMQSPNAFREHIAALLDGGDVTLTTQAPPAAPAGFGPSDVTTLDDTIQIDLTGGIGGKVFRFFSTGNLPAPLDSETDYYLKLVDTSPDQYEVYTDSALNNQVIITTQGTGSHFIVDNSDGWFLSYQTLRERRNVEIEIQFNNGTSFICDIFITNFSITVPLDDKITTQLTFKIDGKYSWSDE
jgi:hypothetical protein